MAASSSHSKLEEQTEERRKGAKDRRTSNEDRRNLDRVIEDFSPRRNPDIDDRRA